MDRFHRDEVIAEILKVGLMPLFYHPAYQTVTNCVKASYTSGCRLFEFTNRGSGAIHLFTRLSTELRSEFPSLILGAGSVIDPHTGAMYIASGANFIVSPISNPDLARLCNRHKVLYIPGCATPTEISQAEEMGAEFAKIFPGDAVGGPKFVKSLLGPSPWSRLIPAGGVEATQESIQAWFSAGVAAVALGSGLFKKDWIKQADYSAISGLCADVVGWIKNSKQ